MVMVAQAAGPHDSMRVTHTVSTALVITRGRPLAWLAGQGMATVANSGLLVTLQCSR